MAAKTAIKEPKRSSALVRRETFASYCFLLPSLIFFLGFVIYPMVLCVVTSFFDSTMNRADIFVGLANYKELFTDPIFLGAGAAGRPCRCRSTCGKADGRSRAGCAAGGAAAGLPPSQSGGAGAGGASSCRSRSKQTIKEEL